MQKALAAAPKVALLAGAAVMVAAAGAVGYAVGARAPGASRGQRFHRGLLALCQARRGVARTLLYSLTNAGHRVDEPLRLR